MTLTEYGNIVYIPASVVAFIARSSNILFNEKYSYMSNAMLFSFDRDIQQVNKNYSYPYSIFIESFKMNAEKYFGSKNLYDILELPANAEIHDGKKCTFI